MAAEVARNYFELRGSQKRIDVAKRTLVNLRDTQRLTEARWELGAGSELDVQSSRARLKAIEADIPLLEVAEVQSRHRLAVSLRHLVRDRDRGRRDRSRDDRDPHAHRPAPLRNGC